MSGTCSIGDVKAALTTWTKAVGALKAEASDILSTIEKIGREIADTLTGSNWEAKELVHSMSTQAYDELSVGAAFMESATTKVSTYIASK